MTTNSHAPEAWAKRVLVPVANPATAPALLRMAWQLTDPEEGRLYVLYVTLTGAETNKDALEAFTAIVDDAVNDEIRAELVTRTAPSVARGILDAALEQGVSLMVVGFQAPTGGRLSLGPVVEAVARTAPCDLVVFRNPSRAAIRLEDIKQVIVPVDGSDNSKVAARLGLVLAEAYDAEPTAVYVQIDPDLPNWFGLARIEASLSGLSDARRYRRQVIRANDVVSGVVSRCDQSDMVVLGFSERSSLDRWIFGDIAQRMIAKVPGPVVLAKRAARPDLSPAEKMRRRWLARLAPTLTPSEKADVVRQALELSVPGIDFPFLMLLSSLLASFGLLQNSAAVIIGAMLVAPLMSPLMSFSVGLLLGNLRLMRTAAFTTLTGVLLGLGVAFVSGIVMPIDVSTAEMLARGEPSLLDMGVALASGAAGAYAMARRDIPAALVGVAIAAALVPPLCTVGLALAFGEAQLASGAALLFLTNIVSISLAGSAVFAWLGLRPVPGSHTRRQILVLLAVLSILALPLVGAFREAVRLEQEMSKVRTVLEDEFAQAEVVDIQLSGSKVTATVRGTEFITRARVQSAEQSLKDELGREMHLEVTYWRMVTPYAGSSRGDDEPIPAADH